MSVGAFLDSCGDRGASGGLSFFGLVGFTISVSYVIPSLESVASGGGIFAAWN